MWEREGFLCRVAGGVGVIGVGVRVGRGGRGRVGCRRCWWRARTWSWGAEEVVRLWLVEFVGDEEGWWGGV